jgi:MFS family permease
MARTATVPGRPPLTRGSQDRRALAVMTTAHGIQHFYVAGLAVTYPFVVAQFHVSYAVLGVWLSAAGLLGGLLQAIAGLFRRASARTVIVAMGGASVLGALAPGFGVFGAARVLGAAVSWPQHPVGSAYLSQRFPHRRATVLSWHTAGGSLGTVAVPLLLSAVVTVAGWRWALMILGMALAAGDLLVRLALPLEPTRNPGRRPGSPLSRQSPPPQIPRRRAARRLRRRPGCGSCCAAGGSPPCSPPRPSPPAAGAWAP